MPLREDYDVPPDETLLPPIRLWIVMVVIPAASLIAWLVLPHSAVTVAILALAVLAAVFTAVYWALSVRGLERPPPRNPRPHA